MIVMFVTTCWSHFRSENGYLRKLIKEAVQKQILPEAQKMKFEGISENSELFSTNVSKINTEVILEL